MTGVFLFHTVLRNGATSGYTDTQVGPLGARFIQRSASIVPPLIHLCRSSSEVHTSTVTKKGLLTQQKFRQRSYGRKVRSEIT